MRRWTWRGLGLALCLFAAVSCCPVPAGLGDVNTATPTAFVARVAVEADGSWLAETDAGIRYRIAGAAPGAVGTLVYLEGWIESNGSLVIEQAGAVDAR